MKTSTIIIALTAAFFCGVVNSATISTTIINEPSTLRPTITTSRPTITTSQPSTVLPPLTTPTPIVDNELKNLAMPIGHLYNTTEAIHAEFELQGPVGDEEALKNLTTVIKKAEKEALLLGVHIKHELLANHINPALLFSRRLDLEILRLQAQGLGRVLAQLGEHVLGILGRVSKFPEYELSETIGSAISVLNTKFSNAVLLMAEVDIALRGQLDDLKVVDAKVKAFVDGHLNSLATIVDSLREEGNRELSEELARLRLEGKELNIWQRFQIETQIDVFMYMATYTKHFKELFDRVNN